MVHLTLSDILAEGVPFDQCDDLVELIAAPPADTDASRALECLRATRRTDPKRQF